MRPSHARLPLALLTLAALLLPQFASACQVGPYNFQISKSGPVNITAGGILTYTIVITVPKLDPAIVGGIWSFVSFKITDPIPAGLTFLPAQSSTICKKSGNSVACIQPTTIAQPTFTYYLAFQTPAGVCATYTNKATISTNGLISIATKTSNTVTTTAVCASSSSSSSSSVSSSASSAASSSSSAVSSSASSSSVASSSSSSSSAASSSLSSSSIFSSSSSSTPAFGCIDVIKETYNTQGAPLTPVTQFTFRLDTGTIDYSNGAGLAHFGNVTPGIHTVTEDVPPFWTLFSVTPSGGVVSVQPGDICAVVTFKNRQVLQQSSSSSSSSSPSQFPGCIRVLKQTYTAAGTPITPVEPFTFRLDYNDNITVTNDSAGNALFQNVAAPGVHNVSEFTKEGWTPLAVNPPNGDVLVNPGNVCALVIFQNSQVPSYSLPQCSDGIDNDGDGTSDFFDPGCYPGNVFNPPYFAPNDDSELNAPQLCRWVRQNNQWVRQCL